MSLGIQKGPYKHGEHRPVLEVCSDDLARAAPTVCPAVSPLLCFRHSWEFGLTSGRNPAWLLLPMVASAAWFVLLKNHHASNVAANP